MEVLGSLTGGTPAIRIKGGFPVSSNSAFISAAQEEQLREKLLELLGKKGVEIEHPKVLHLLKEAGAEVDEHNSRVFFPPDFLEGVLKQAPREFLLSGADPEYDLQLPRPGGSFYLRTSTGAPNYIEPLSGIYRRTKVQDIVEWAELANTLEQIGFTAFPSPWDTPNKTADVHALASMLKHSVKHIWVQPYSNESIAYLLELCEAAAGSGEALQKRPLASFITCALTPLTFKYMDMEVILQASSRGLPVHACSLPSAGGTAPMTMPGVILLAAAEIAVMAAVAQVVRPGSPVVATPLIFALDMKTGRTAHTTVEAIRGASAATKFLKAALGIPTHTYGLGSDSPTLDGQSMSERSLLGMMVALAGTDILGGAGQLEVATTISPLQLVLDDELARVILGITTGLEVNEDNMAWEDLLRVTPGGHFLETEHTLQNCRKVVSRDVFTNMSRETWTKRGVKDLLLRTQERFSYLMDNRVTKELPAETAREIDNIVETADRNLM